MSQAPKTTAKSDASPWGEGLDAREVARRAYAPALDDALTRVRGLLRGLREVPQVLLFEGGTEPQRQALARWWAARIHCPSCAVSVMSPAGAPVNTPHDHTQNEPCLQCPVCVQIGAGIFHDVLMYDGRISNKDDEENPGPVRAFTMDNARDLKSRIADAPRSGGKRVVLLSGIDITREIASNALLKTLEEPSPTTVFVLLAPQREQLLPTLVSRSWVLTLPWPDATQRRPDMEPWEQTLAAFLRTGREWWAMTAAKGSVDQTMAQEVLLHWQKALVRSFTPDAAPTVLQELFTRLSPLARQQATVVFDSAQESLGYGVSPPRVLDAVATELYVLLRQ